MASPEHVLPPLLAALPAGVRSVLMSARERRERGEQLFAQGDPSDTCWILLRGVLLVERSHALSPEPQLLGVFSRGDLIGEVGLLRDTDRTAGARALTPLELVSLPRARFEELLRTCAPFAAELARCLAGRLLATNELLPGVPPRLVGLVGLPLGVAEGLAAALARQSARLVAVTAWPDARGLPRRLGLDAPGRSVVTHPRGFHVLVHRGALGPEEGVPLAETLRARYGYALICLERWTGEAAALFAEDEPILVSEGQDLPDRAVAPLVLGSGSEAGLRLPPESAQEGFERTMSELARRVQRSIPIVVQTTRETRRSWAAPAELGQTLARLLDELAADPELVAISVGGRTLTL